MASIVWSVWGVFEDPPSPFEAHVLAPEEWSEEEVVASAATAYAARADEDGQETARMLRATGEAAPLLGIDSARHRLDVVYDPSAPYRLVIREAWADVELHLG
jgi:hypothetical protein